MNRRYPERPLVGVGGIVIRGERVLLVKRGREPAYGKWSLPGGLVELGESLREAVRREVGEEVGLEVEVRDLLVALDRVILDQHGKIEYHYILMDFLCNSPEGDPSPSSDVTDCAFVPLNALSSYVLTKGTEEVIRRAFMKIRGIDHPVYDPDV
jgi:8-oxo-dGTP diphosphatase